MKTSDVTGEPGEPAVGPSLGAASGALIVVCLALGATGSIEARLVSLVHGTPVSWTVLLLSTVPRWALLAVVLPLVLRLAWRYPLVPATTRAVLLHAGVFLALSLGHAVVHAWSVGVGAPFGFSPFPWSARITRSWLNTMPTLVFVYGAILVATWGMAQARERQQRALREAKLEAQLQAARLAALRAQLQPHFLYNTLNGIAALVADLEPARAVRAIEQLGELLHVALEEDGRETIALREEIALAERYLALQQLRFGDRLRYRLEASPDAADCAVPALLLQPVVENAVVHGLDAGQVCLRVTVAALVIDGRLELRVENDGPDLAEAADPPGRGLGLASTRARLETAYGAAAGLALEPRPGGGVRVTIRVPVGSRSSERRTVDAADGALIGA